MSTAFNDVFLMYDQARFICTVCHKCWDVMWIGKAKSAPWFGVLGTLSDWDGWPLSTPLSKYPQGPAGASESSVALFSSHSPLLRYLQSRRLEPESRGGILKTADSGKALLIFSLRCLRREFSDWWVKAT